MAQKFPELPILGAHTGEGIDLPPDILNRLPESEQKKAIAFLGDIDPTDPAQMRMYGAAEQGALASFVDTALPVMLNAPAGDAGEAVAQLQGQLSRWDERVSSKGLIGRLLWMIVPDFQLSRLRSSFSKTWPAMEKTADQLFDARVSLMRLAVQLEKLQKENEARFDRLTAYVALGKLKLKRMESEGRDDEQWREAQKRLDIRVHDLMLSRQVCLQVAAQISILLSSSRLTEQQLQTTLTSTIPLWKTQAMILLGMKQQEAYDRYQKDAQQAFSKSAQAGVEEIGRTAKRERADRLHESNQTLSRGIEGFVTSLKNLDAQQKGADREIRPLREEANRAMPSA